MSVWRDRVIFHLKNKSSEFSLGAKNSWLSIDCVAVQQSVLSLTYNEEKILLIQLTYLCILRNLSRGSIIKHLIWRIVYCSASQMNIFLNSLNAIVSFEKLSCLFITIWYCQFDISCLAGRWQWQVRCLLNILNISTCSHETIVWQSREHASASSLLVTTRVNFSTSDSTGDICHRAHLYKQLFGPLLRSIASREWYLHW